MSDEKKDAPVGLTAWLESKGPSRLCRITPELREESRRIAEALARGEMVIDLGSDGVPVIEVESEDP